MTASPGDGEHAAREGYYPDPSIPGYVRYWNGLSWVPGTSRPAPPAPPADETGPVRLDETSATEVLPEPEPEPERAAGPVGWQADPAQQYGFGGPRDARVSWGSPAEAAEPVDRPERGPGVSMARTPAAAAAAAEQFPAPARSRAQAQAPLLAQAQEYAQAQSPAPFPAPLSAQGQGQAEGQAQSPVGPQAQSPAPLSAQAQGKAQAWAQAPIGSQAQSPAPAPLSAQGQAQGQTQAPIGSQALAPLSAQEYAQAQAQAQAQAPIRSQAQSPAPAPAPASGSGSAEGVGILSARSPVAPVTEWPDALGGGVGGSGLTSSWPEVAPQPRAAAPAAPVAPMIPRPAPAPEPATPAAPTPAAPAPAASAPAVPAPAASAPAVPATPAAPAVPATPAAPVAPAPVAPATPAASRPTARAVFERMAERAVRPAGLVRRAVARALDSLVLGAVAAAAAWPLVPEATAHIQAKLDAARVSGRTTTVWLLDGTIAGYLGLVVAAVLLFGVFYEALPTACWGRTPGKKLLGIRVLATGTLRPPTFGAALRRWLVYALLGLPGSPWCLVDRPRRRGWHDKAAGTYVAR